MSSKTYSARTTIRAKTAPSGRPPWVGRVPGLYEVPVYELRSVKEIRYVYALCRGPDTLYVGETGRRLLRRMEEHAERFSAEGRPMFTTFFALPVPAPLARRVEAALIRWLHPSYNAYPGPLRERDRVLLQRLGIRA